MAVAIIRQLTLAQVQAAIDAGSTSWNNNYAGTQVYVTDKDWHLACYLDRVAKPLSGVLKITNGDTLPNWLTPETLLIDTGTITANIDGTEGNPALNITGIAGYFPRYLYTESTSILASVDFVLYDVDDGTLAAVGSYGTAAIMDSGFKIGGSYIQNEYIVKLTAGYVEGDYVRAIIEYRKIPL